MSLLEVRREAFANGTVRLTSGDCQFVYQRPRPGLLHVVVSGLDKGQFGSSTLDEIRAEIGRESRLELFVDAREALGVSVSVSEEWTRFFSQSRQSLTQVSVLVSSKSMSLTVAIARHLSRTGNLIQIYSDLDLFETQLARQAQQPTFYAHASRRQFG